jgi:uncharacterized LabA/DUF88 family protein
MPRAFNNQRVGIFLDIQNIYHSAKNLHRARVNFQELVKTLVRDRTLVRAIAYVVKSETALGEESFFDALRKTGFELRSKDIQIYPDGSKKADWDIGMAVDSIRMASSLDTIVLVTGDGDFVPLVEYLRIGLGKHVEVAGFGRTSSGRLKESTDHFTDLENVSKLLIPIKVHPANIKTKKPFSPRQ